MASLVDFSLTFPKPGAKKNGKDNWKDVAKDALCETKDPNGVMKALKGYDDRSSWFVLVSSGKKGDTLRRTRRHDSSGKGWSANYKEGELYDTDKCDSTMVVWLGRFLKMGESSTCDTKKAISAMLPPGKEQQ